MQKNSSISPTLVSLLFALTSATIYAQTPDSTAAPQRVEEVIVKSAKNAAMMPYDAVYERLKRFEESKLDRVKFEITVTPKNPELKQSDIRAALVNDTKSIPVKIDAEGRVELPMRADFYKTGAELVGNQPKNALNTKVSINMSWSAGTEVPYAEVEETVRQLQTAGKDLLGWFGYMLFFPSLTNIDIPIQYKTANGQTLNVMKDGRVIQSFKADDKGLLQFRLDRRWSEWQPTLVFSEAPKL